MKILLVPRPLTLPETSTPIALNPNPYAEPLVQTPEMISEQVPESQVVSRTVSPTVLIRGVFSAARIW